MIENNDAKEQFIGKNAFIAFVEKKTMLNESIEDQLDSKSSS